MADEVARRRELRRRRILDNAEERKQKIFGTSIDGVDSTNETNKPNEAKLQDSTQSPLSKSSLKDEDGSANSVPHIQNTRTLQDSTQSPLSKSSLKDEDGSANSVPYIQHTRTLQDSTQSPLSKSSLKDEEGSANSVPHTQHTRTLPTLNSTEFQNSLRLDKAESDDDDDAVESRSAPNFRAENGIESVPEISEHLRNLNDILTANGSRNIGATPTRKLNVVQPPAAVGALGSPIVPVILALFVCVLLSVKLDYVVSNSIALPFLLWEAHHLWCHRHVIENMSRGVGGLMGLALVLCGVQQSLISKMTQILSVAKCVFEDFAFYILTVVLWYCVIGLPGSLHSLNHYSEPQTVNEFSAPETVKVASSEDDMFDHLENF